MRLLAFLRTIVWSAVLSVAFTLAAIIVAIIWPDMLTLVIALGASGITFGVLATKE